MSFWAVGAAAVGVVSTVVASNNSKSAAKKAANASQSASDKSIDLAREERDAAQAALQPYSDAGLDALAAIRTMLGLPAQAATQRTQEQTRQQIADGPSEAELMEMFPQHAAFWRRWEAAGNSKTNGHRTTFGDFEGYLRAEAGDFDQKVSAWRAEQQAALDAQQPITNQAAPNETTAETPSGYEASFYSKLVDDAKASFEDSPWWEFAKQETDQAINDLDAKYGASGLMLSGQGVRARAEIAARMKGDAFDKHYNQQVGAKSDYLSSLFGVFDAGHQAATGIASGGQAFANTATQALTNNARVQSDAAIAKGQAGSQMWSDIAGFGGWATGQIGQQPSTTPKTFQSPTPITPTVVPKLSY